MAITKTRQIRIPNDLWDKAMKRARHDGTTVSELVRTWLDEYANESVSVTEELSRIMVALKRIRTRLSLDTLSGERRTVPPL